MNNTLIKLIKIEKSFDISVVGLRFKIDVNDLSFIEIRDIQLDGFFGQRAFTSNADADIFLQQAAVAMRIVALHDDIGGKACSAADVQQDFMRGSSLSHGDKGMVGELIEG